MHCNKAQFTVINRRHHCRNCVLIICGNCSKNKFLIPSQSSKPVRVCDTCFGELCQRRVSSAPDAASQTEILKSVDANGSSGEAEPVTITTDDVSVEDNNAAAESSDSDEDSADQLENATANISIEDEKPIFYSEVPADQEKDDS
jgi:hypothetical protein